MQSQGEKRNARKEENAKNLCLKTRKKTEPYEVWKSPDGTWTWNVLKKWQADDEKPFARWFCFVTSPYCPDGEYGDTYVNDIKQNAERVFETQTKAYTETV